MRRNVSTFIFQRLNSQKFFDGAFHIKLYNKFPFIEKYLVRVVQYLYFDTGKILQDIIYGKRLQEESFPTEQEKNQVARLESYLVEKFSSVLLSGVILGYLLKEDVINNRLDDTQIPVYFCKDCKTVMDLAHSDGLGKHACIKCNSYNIGLEIKKIEDKTEYKDNIDRALQRIIGGSEGLYFCEVCNARLPKGDTSKVHTKDCIVLIAREFIAKEGKDRKEGLGRIIASAKYKNKHEKICVLCDCLLPGHDKNCPQQLSYEILNGKK